VHGPGPRTTIGQVQLPVDQRPGPGPVPHTPGTPRLAVLYPARRAVYCLHAPPTCGLFRKPVSSMPAPRPGPRSRRPRNPAAHPRTASADQHKIISRPLHPVRGRVPVKSASTSRSSARLRQQPQQGRPRRRRDGACANSPATSANMSLDPPATPPGHLWRNGHRVFDGPSHPSRSRGGRLMSRRHAGHHHKLLLSY